MASGVIVVLVPVHLVSVANAREHYMAKARRTKLHRDAARMMLRPHKPPTGPVAVTIARIAPRPLDGHDNLRSACKALVDGVADWLGVDDGSDLVSWQYAQRKGKPKEYAAEIVVTFEVTV